MKLLIVLFITIFIGTGSLFIGMTWYSSINENLHDFEFVKFSDMGPGNNGVRSNELQTQEEPHSSSSVFVIEEYRIQLKELEEQAEQDLNSLVVEAKGEYVALKEQGGDSIPYFKLFTKYSKKAHELERRIDSSFEEIYEDLINDLMELGHHPSYAESLMEEYEEMKRQKREALMKSLL